MKFTLFWGQTWEPLLLNQKYCYWPVSQSHVMLIRIHLPPGHVFRNVVRGRPVTRFRVFAKNGQFSQICSPYPLEIEKSQRTKAHLHHVGHATINRPSFKSAYFGALCWAPTGYQKKPQFFMFLKIWPPKGSKIQILPRNDSTQCGTWFVDVDSALEAALEVPNPMRERVTEKRKNISLTQNGAGGRTAVKLSQHLGKFAQFFKWKFIQIGSAVPGIIAKNLDHTHQSNHSNACNLHCMH